MCVERTAETPDPSLSLSNELDHYQLDDVDEIGDANDSCLCHISLSCGYRRGRGRCCFPFDSIRNGGEPPQYAPLGPGVRGRGGGTDWEVRIVGVGQDLGRG